SDHDGAVQHWREHFTAWTLVHNSREGLPPELVKLLLDLGAFDTTVIVAPWGHVELVGRLRGLAGPRPRAPLGPPITRRSVLGVRYEDLKNVMPALSGALAVQPTAIDLRPVPPEKLQFNRLSEAAKLHLLQGMQVSDRVRSFFERWEPGSGDKVASAFRRRY